MDKLKIGGIMQSDGRALVRLMSVPFNAGMAAGVLASLGEAGINIELLVESFDLDDNANFAMVIDQKDLDHALAALEEAKAQVGAKGVAYTPDVAILSLFGPHLREKPLVPGMMLGALAGAGVSPLALANSISSFSCLVAQADLAAAEEALGQVFELPFAVARRPGGY